MRFPQALVIFMCACQPTGTLSATQVAAEPPIESNADTICGSGWKWDGKRCNELEHAKSLKPGMGPTGTTDPNGPQLQVQDTVVGTGPEVKPGDQISVHYTGTLSDGRQFDSSRPRGKPFDFRVGAAMVIKGFDRGVVGMKVGGVRKIIIPPELGYGTKGAPPTIPPRATLVFEIELLQIK